MCLEQTAEGNELHFKMGFFAQPNQRKWKIIWAECQVKEEKKERNQYFGYFAGAECLTSLFELPEPELKATWCGC